MQIIKLNGANPEKIAKIIGATLVMYNETDDEATYFGGDITKLNGYTVKVLK